MKATLGIWNLVYWLRVGVGAREPLGRDERLGCGGRLSSHSSIPEPERLSWWEWVHPARGQAEGSRHRPLSIQHKQRRHRSHMCLGSQRWPLEKKEL